jgi:CubicO group peptidase (beta-lactamase class C family)
MRKFMLGLFCFLFGTNVVIANSEDAFRTWIKSSMKKLDIPGISIAVIKDYKIAWIEGFGMADVANARLVTPEVLFQAGSISKPVTAMAALKSVQDGKIALHANINNFLTSWKIPSSVYTKKTGINLEKLLSHSAGINVSGFWGYSREEKVPSLLEILNGQSPAHSEPIRVVGPVGKHYEYSGGGYTIIQQALIDTWHQPFNRILEKLIFKPLNMRNSRFDQPLPKSLEPVAALPYRNGQLLPDGPYIYPELAAAGLWTTPADLAKFTISIQKSLNNDPGQILSKKYAKLMTVIPKSQSSREKTSAIIQMGLGFIIGLNKYGKGAKNGSYFGHAGQNEGYRMFLLADSRKGNGVIIMTNMSPPADKPDDWKFIFAIVKKIADKYQWN